MKSSQLIFPVHKQEKQQLHIHYRSWLFSCPPASIQNQSVKGQCRVPSLKTFRFHRSNKNRSKTWNFRQTITTKPREEKSDSSFQGSDELFLPRRNKLSGLLKSFWSTVLVREVDRGLKALTDSCLLEDYASLQVRMSTLWSGSWSKIKENSRLMHDSPNTNTQERLEKLLTCKTPGARFRERSPKFNSINQEEIMDWKLCPRSWNQFFISFFLIGHQHLHIWMYIWWWFY